ncbi:MAG TPA: DNA polymerase/3'-5' exonuclease PolX [Candidatus Angelobacter sp.]|jgi:DNA polymerase (family 10)|nr:DNA polymerase/3'-5' exonuclease PolX [Candidatus Angelobacter sp.]
MDNKAIATLFYEAAELMEVRGDDSFRIRSYRNAAEALESLQQQVAEICQDEKALLAIPGIGKSMAGHIRDVCSGGKLKIREELLQKYRPSMLDLLKIQGLGPKTIALIWDAFQICDIDGVAKLAQEGKLRTLPRLSEKSEQKILKAIESYRQITGRFLIDKADEVAAKMISLLEGLPGVEKITPAGSLRRGKETVGDVDLLVTGKCCANEEQRNQVIEQILSFPGILDVLAKGENKVSFKLRGGMQVDVRLLPPDSFGAALQYFTGSKSHNVSLRQRALRLGYTLNEYGLVRMEDNQRVAGGSEEEIYKKLGVAYIPPELRENCGEVEAAEKGELPELITQADLQGDVHMHTVETDGKCTIEEMAKAARERGYQYMAITDHSKNLAFANGLDDKRAEEHIKKIRKANQQTEGITIFAGIEVDILAEGDLDLSDSVLEQMDLVIASVHSHFQQDHAQMTDRLLRALSNPNVSLIGHPTGRVLLRREGYSYDAEKVFAAAAQVGIAMEHNAYPDRLDLRDQHLRLAKSKGTKIVINTDSHHTSHMEKMRYGVLQLRRAWLTKQDVLNTLPVGEFAKVMRRGRAVLAEM